MQKEAWGSRVLTETRIELRGCAGALTSTAGGGAGTERGDEVSAEVGVEAAGSGKFVASGRSSPGGFPWWGRRGALGNAAAVLPALTPGVRWRGSVRRLVLAGLW
jgi:hypothetical protein